jgi:eukaryotic-like serine/threonine-protein kinase
VHRDLKPSNIFGAEGTVKVGDIGLSKFITASRRSAHTESVGTVYYMAPEISRGRYGKEVDLYALGVIAFEMATGQIPFDGESAGEILMKHLTQPPNLSLLPERLRAVIGKALAKDPARRQRSTLEFLREFEAAVVGRTTARHPQPLAAVAGPARRAVGFPRSTHPSEPGLFEGSNLAVLIGGAVLSVVMPFIFIPLLIAFCVVTQQRIKRERDALGTPGQYVREIASRGSRPASTALDRGKRPLPTNLATQIQVAAGEEVWLPETPRPTSARSPELPWYGHWFLLLVFGGLLLFAVRSGGGATSNGIVVMGVMSLAFVALAVKTFRFGTEVIYGLSGTSSSPPRAARSSPLAPLRSRQDQIHSLTTSAFFAPLSVTALTGTIGLARPELLNLHQNDLSLATVFVTVATLSTWIISLLSTISEGQNWDKWTRRGLFGAGGLVTGTAAYAVWRTLFSPGSILFSTFGQEKMFTHLGSHDLLTDTGLPTLAGFLCFFGVFFALINWTKQTDSLRKSRFGLWSLAASVIVGALSSMVLAFPTGAAVLWAGVISASVQLTSPGLGKQRA